MKSPEPLDAAVVIRCQLGHKDAWEALVLRWHPRLWGFVSHMLSDRAIAEDVLQTIWLRVIRSLACLREPDRFPAWVYRIARIAIADQLREQYRQPVAETFGDIQDHDADDGASMLETKEAVEKALALLHPVDRETVILHYLEEFSVNEVAEICALAPGTVKSRLHRARRIIRETLTSEGR